MHNFSAKWSATKQYPEAIICIFIEITFTSMPFRAQYVVLLLSAHSLFLASVYLFL